MHWIFGASIVLLARASCGQAIEGQRHRRQQGYGGYNSTDAGQDQPVVVESTTSVVETSVVFSYAPPSGSYGVASSSMTPESSSNAISATFTYGASTSGSLVSSAVTEVSQITTYLTVSASEYASPSTTSTASPSNYAPPPVGPATGTETVKFSYAPTTTAVQSPPVVTSTTTDNATCGGATLNVLDASLDWWYVQTYSYAVSTISILFNSDDVQTGWTVLPATTSFNITSAIAQAKCTPTPTYNTYINKTITVDACSSTPAPVAASTTLVSVDAFTAANLTTGNGTVLPSLGVTPTPASITIPRSAGNYSAGTPFVFFSAYEIESKKPTTYLNGSEGCATSTRVYNMSKPFSFEYEGPDVNGSLLVGQDAVGDVNPAFLNVVNQTYATAGSWVAAPTMAVVVQRVVVAQAVLAAHTEVSESFLDVPTPTLPPYISAVSPTVASQTIAVPSPRIESSAGQLDVPTTHHNFIGPQTFIAHLESSDSTLILPTPTDVSSFATTMDGTTITAFAEGAVPPRTSTSSKSNIVKPFVAHLESTNVILDVPVPETQTVVTAVKDDVTYTATAMSAIETQGSGSNSGDHQGDAGAGYGGLIGAIISAVKPSPAKPTNALEVLTQALGQETGNPTASAILAGLGGSGPSQGPAQGSSQGSNAQQDSLPASPAQALSLNGATVTPHSASAFVVGGQTAVAGGAPITVSGTVISVPASTNAIVVGGSTVALSGSSSVFNANGMSVTAEGVQAYPVGGQMLVPGGRAITVDGHQYSLMPNGNAVVIDGSTSTMAAGGSPTGIPLLTVGSQTYTANAATQYYFGDGEILTPGGSVVVSGTTISLGSDASALVVNGQTQTLSAPMITPGPSITMDGTAYAPNAADAYNVGGQMLTPGGVITVSGTTLSLASDGSAVVVNGQTQTLSSSGSGSNTAAITAPAVLTVDGQAYSPNAGTSYLISGQTLTPGGTITISGPNGQETISLDSSGSVLVDTMSGHTMKSTIAGVGDTAPTAAPVLTIGDQTFTALPGSAGDNPSYVIDGQTLTPGAVETVTVAGHTYIVSLSPHATVLEVEVEGSGGKVMATSFETLFPATNTRGTVYMTATGSGSSRSGSASSGATGRGSATAGAGLQSSATAVGASSPILSVAVAAAVGTLLLAIWL